METAAAEEEMVEATAVATEAAAVAMDVEVVAPGGMLRWTTPRRRDRGPDGGETVGRREKDGIRKREWAACIGFAHRSIFLHVGRNDGQEKRCRTPGTCHLFDKTASHDLSARQKPALS